MAKRSKGMTDAELTVIVDGWLSDAESFDQSDMSGIRSKAIDFYEGRIDIQAEPGKSSVVSPDLADALEWIIPGLLRVFLASDRVAIYEPVTQEDEETAKQATDGINHEFLVSCNGYRILKDAMHDGLLHGNGVIKHWWAGEPEYKTETLTALNEEEYQALLLDETVEEVLEQREYMVGPDGQEIKGDKEYAE
jgi:hypothetical protein